MFVVVILIISVLGWIITFKLSKGRFLQRILNVTAIIVAFDTVQNIQFHFFPWNINLVVCIIYFSIFAIIELIYMIKTK